MKRYVVGVRLDSRNKKSNCNLIQPEKRIIFPNGTCKHVDGAKDGGDLWNI